MTQGCAPAGSFFFSFCRRTTTKRRQSGAILRKRRGAHRLANTWWTCHLTLYRIITIKQVGCASKVVIATYHRLKVKQYRSIANLATAWKNFFFLPRHSFLWNELVYSDLFFSVYNSTFSKCSNKMSNQHTCKKKQRVRATVHGMAVNPGCGKEEAIRRRSSIYMYYKDC